MNIVRTEEEIDSLKSWVDAGTHYSEMSYEDGIRDTLDWLFGRRDKSPAEDKWGWASWMFDDE
jgi:hypothetical protein